MWFWDSVLSLTDLIHSFPNTQRRDSVMEKRKYSGPEKRKHSRIVYDPSMRPSFKVKDHELEVVDISEGGIRIKSEPDVFAFYSPRVQGTIEFLDGESINIEGEISWIIGDEIRLKFMSLIPSVTIEKERGRI